MAKTVGDFIYERLRAWGVERVFGYPGDGINGIMAAFEHGGDVFRRNSLEQAPFHLSQALHGEWRKRERRAAPSFLACHPWSDGRGGARRQ